ncbi:hypothetical protein [Granulicella tundricola]|uniref:Outer membrane protein beta-barrel domain-containing protein n=1 Tax=Granulicella tundricola (strain ATCC BAA-1859 / DSM 23138 / MP5ACTX9) TaxID=1198114 RepID=E8WYR1_GRATM|nr:hypothetical protein [Granulicella tundricola]ADW68747.1 hypothetical protein AciX9_1698 [Granulicella tundricola MP5ACTX9]
MIRKSLVLLAALFAGTTVSAHSQAAVYGLFTVDSISVPPYIAPGNNTNVTKDHLNPIGGTFGVYYDYRTFGPVRLGFDVRGVETTSKVQGIDSFDGAGIRVYSVLGGVRGSFHTPIRALKPYVQGSAGLGRSDRGQPVRTLANHLEYHGFAGLDIKLLPYMDWRAIEAGYGGISFGGTLGTEGVRTLSTGIVFHMP